MEKPVVGLEVNSVQDLNEALDQARAEHFDWISCPLMHPRLRRDATGISENREGPVTRSDMILPGGTWSSCIVGKASEWLDLDSPCARVRRAGEQSLKQELAWATHLGVPAVLAPEPLDIKTHQNYGRVLHQALKSCNFLQVWVRIPTMGTQEMLDGLEEGQESLQWQKWNRLRFICNHLPNLSVALEVTADLPTDEELRRWLGEPIKAVILPTSVFLTNKNGFPTLSRRHQKLVKSCLQRKIQFLLKGRCRHERGYFPYIQYLDHLRGLLTPPSEEDKFSVPYQDYLQVPLQPLMDNLESQTYETFEKDPIKYCQYELAIEKALNDTPEDKVTTLMVVGAGRGPLVRASLRASETTNRKLKVFAVEKNPNAIITLRNMAISERWDNVTIVSTDMRSWKTEERADILVSELLGSFGDNELSPECLDGAQEFLKPGGISIPADYTSYLAPISSPKLWNEVRAFNDAKKYETAYVVKMHNFYQIAEAKPCFKFVHPNPEPREKIDNRRYLSLIFETQIAATLYGFAGYFEARLYADVYISIVPQTFSDGMFSWFPLYFPVIKPIFVPKGETIGAGFWRCISPTKVWYEWNVDTPEISVIHNCNGHSYWIGL